MYIQNLKLSRYDDKFGKSIKCENVEDKKHSVNDFGKC
jgi:hypothetical protein